VLLATAGEGQRRVGPAEAADLIKGAIKMHLGISRSPRPVRNAVRLMCLGAVLTLAVLVTVLVTLGSVRSAIVQDFTVAHSTLGYRTPAEALTAFQVSGHMSW
jgi:hypothetical protein